MSLCFWGVQGHRTSVGCSSSGSYLLEICILRDANFCYALVFAILFPRGSCFDSALNLSSNPRLHGSRFDGELNVSSTMRQCLRYGPRRTTDISVSDIRCMTLMGERVILPTWTAVLLCEGRRPRPRQGCHVVSEDTGDVPRTMIAKELAGVTAGFCHAVSRAFARRHKKH